MQQSLHECYTQIFLECSFTILRNKRRPQIECDRINEAARVRRVFNTRVPIVPIHLCTHSRDCVRNRNDRLNGVLHSYH